MSFSPLCILEEFAEASRYGRTNHVERAFREYWTRRTGKVRTKRGIPKRIVLTPTMSFPPLALIACQLCGEVCNSRIGYPGVAYHPAKSTCPTAKGKRMSDLKTKDIVEWIYPRPEGDITVYAVTREEAASTIRQHGFLVTEPDKIKRGDSVLTAHLKREQIS